MSLYKKPNHILQLNCDDFIAEDVRSGLGTPMHFSACQGSTLLLGSSRAVSLELSCGLSCRTSSLSLALELRGVSLQISRDFVEDIMVQGARMKDVLQQLHNVAQVQYHSSVNLLRCISTWCLLGDNCFIGLSSDGLGDFLNSLGDLSFKFWCMLKL